MDRAQRGVAGLPRRHDDAERHDVGELLEGDVAALHLLPDRVGRLLAPGDLDHLRRRLPRRPGAVRGAPPRSRRRPGRAGSSAGPGWCRTPRGPARRTPVSAARSSPRPCRCVRRAARRSPSSRGRCGWRRSGSRTKRSVRMLCSRSASFTSSTRMSRLIARTSLRKFSACLVRSDCSSSRVSLVTPSTSVGDLVPEALVDFGQLDRRILDHVVQQPGDDRGGIQPVAGQDVGHRQRVGDVGVAVVAPLRAVRLLGHHVRVVDQTGVGLRIVSRAAWLRQRGAPSGGRAGGGAMAARPWPPWADPVRRVARGRRGRAASDPARPRAAWRLTCVRPPSSASIAASMSSGDISSFSTGRPAASSSALTSCRPKMFWSVGMRSSTSSSAGSGSGARDSDFTRSCSMRSRSMVSSAISRRATTGFLSLSRSMVSSSPRRQVARPLGGEQHQLEAVGDLLDAIFDSDARHAQQSPIEAAGPTYVGERRAFCKCEAENVGVG